MEVTVTDQCRPLSSSAVLGDGRQLDLYELEDSEERTEAQNNL